MSTPDEPRRTVPRPRKRPPPLEAGSPAAGARAYHHGDLRRALVMSGVQTLESRGAEAISLRQAARDVGVSQTAPLHHFDTKTAYLAAIAAEGFRMLFERRTQVMRTRHDPAERLLGVMLAYLHFAADHGAMFRLMYGSAIPDKSAHVDLHEAAARSFGVLEACVADYLTHRGIPLTGLRWATLAAWAAGQGLAHVLAERESAWGVVGGDPEKIGRNVFGIFIAGLENLAPRAEAAS